MKGKERRLRTEGWKRRWGLLTLLAATASIWLAGCRASPAEKSNANSFTSGSREADQRASQRMAQSEQLSGSSEAAGEKRVKKAQTKEGTSSAGGATNMAAQAVDRPLEFGDGLHATGAGRSSRQLGEAGRDEGGLLVPCGEIGDLARNS